MALKAASAGWTATNPSTCCRDCNRVAKGYERRRRAAKAQTLRPYRRFGSAYVPFSVERIRHYVELVALPGRVVELQIARTQPDDYQVRFTLDSGAVIEATGRTFYDPPVPFEDAAEVFSFLIMQGTPAELVYRELIALDPQWESKVEERRRSQPWTLERRAEDERRRQELRAAHRSTDNG